MVGVGKKGGVARWGKEKREWGQTGRGASIKRRKRETK